MNISCYGGFRIEKKRMAWCLYGKQNPRLRKLCSYCHYFHSVEQHTF